MWRIFTIAALVALAGCSTQHAVRVRCDRHLVPINVPADGHSVRSRSLAAQGEKR
jgi:hypothetical protein